MEWNDDCQLSRSKLHVASSLADLLKSNGGQCFDGGCSADDGKRRTQAVS